MTETKWTVGFIAASKRTRDRAELEVLGGEEVLARYPVQDCTGGIIRGLSSTRQQCLVLATSSRVVTMAAKGAYSWLLQSPGIIWVLLPAKPPRLLFEVPVSRVSAEVSKGLSRNYATLTVPGGEWVFRFKRTKHAKEFVELIQHHASPHASATHWVLHD